jgi:hypothetical protein
MSRRGKKKRANAQKHERANVSSSRQSILLFLIHFSRRKVGGREERCVHDFARFIEGIGVDESMKSKKTS